jgi:pimeloyl-ACP methyl ester carboxylesterase
MKPSGAQYFCGDLSDADQKLVYATHFAPAADLFLHNAPGVAWRTKPSWAIVGANDHTVNPELERSSAKRMGATTYELDSSHVPMLSQPDRVLDVIRAAAAGV